MHIAANALKVIFCATDSQGRTTLFEGPGLECLPLNPSDVLGKPIFELTKDQPEATALIRRALAGEGVIATLEAHGRVFEVHLTPVYDQDRAVSGMVGVAIDVTESRSLQRSLEEERLKRSRLESLAVRAGALSHEFNNLLTGVLGNLSLAQMEADPASSLGVSLTSAERACLRTRDLVAALSEFSQEGGFEKRPVSLEPCIRQAVLAAAFGVEIRCGIRVDPHLWAVSADEPRISQVLKNLLAYARKAMGGGGIIEIDAWNTRAAEPLRPGKYVAVRLTHHGDQRSGIQTREDLAGIFEPDSTGAGCFALATARTIIANHGGQLLAESHGSAGVSFTIHLPAVLAEAPRPPEAPQATPKIETHARILVMDDEQSIRDLTRRMLSSAGFQVDTADEGRDAVRQYRDAFEAGQPFDAVLLDLRVPCGMGGYETFEAIRGIDPAVKAIISSGHFENPIMSNFREHGIAAVIPKPYSVSELLAAVRQTVS